MYRDQAYILINIIMMLDALVVIFAAYFSRWIYLNYFWGIWLLREYEFADFIIIFQVFAIIDKGLMLGVIGMLANRGFHQRRILLVGNGARSLRVVDALQKQQSWGHRIVGLLRDEEEREDICAA